MTRANHRLQSGARPRKLRIAVIAVIILAACVALFAGMYPRWAGAQTGPGLGVAESFAVLAGSTVTNTDTPTVVYGDLGVSPGTAVTGFPPGVVHGEVHENTAVAQDAQGGVTQAFGALDQPCAENLTGENLGNRTLTSGVYCYDTSAGMTGTLTLDGEGDENAVFIIKIGSTLTTASNSSVELIGNADACNVFWRVGSSATLGTTTSFAGNILAQESITLDTGTTIVGRALARTGAVTMDDNVVDASPCGAEAPTATPTSTPDPDATPTPTSTPVDDTPTPVGTPVDDTPTPVGTPVDDTPTPVGTPVDDTPTPVGTPVDDTPTPVGTPVDDTPTPVGTPVDDVTPTPAPPVTGSGTADGGPGSSLMISFGIIAMLAGAAGWLALPTRRR